MKKHSSGTAAVKHAWYWPVGNSNKKSRRAADITDIKRIDEKRGRLTDAPLFQKALHVIIHIMFQ